MILNYILSIDTDTMEFTVKDAECPKNCATVKLPSKETPRLHLEKNKFTLNDAAINLLKLKPGDKVSIEFTEAGTPLIGSIEALRVENGNKLTKAGTVSFRGKMNDLLLEHGSDFDIEPDGEGVGLLKAGGAVVAVIEEPQPDQPEKVDDTIPTTIFDLLGKDEDFTMSSFDFSFK